MPPTNIALVGATGNLGQPILAALLAAGHTVTVLSRIGGNSSKLHYHPRLTVKEVDLSSITSLAPALAGVDVVIAALATRMIDAQTSLIDAAVQAEVSRFIPAAFGMDSANERAITLPVCGSKAATQAYLDAKSRETGGRFTWTAISNGWFLDWVLQTTDILMDVKAHRMTLYNGGDVRCSATLLGDVAKAVVGVVEKREETRNRVVYVHSAVVTQRQLMGYVKERDGVEWDTRVKGTGVLLGEIEDAVGRRDDDAATLGACIVGCSDGEYGCDYTGREDNELLGLKNMSEEELRALVQGLI